MNKPVVLAQRIALGAYLGLLALVIYGESVAPATPVPRAFWLGLKTLPLLVPLYWLVRANPTAYVLAALLMLLYFCDGIMAVYLGARMQVPWQLGYGIAETGTALLFIAAASGYARSSMARARAAE